MNPDSPTRPATTFAVALVIGLVAAGTYFGLTTPRLGHPGAYYDELNKAVSAFAWVGRPSHLFSHVKIGAIPLMVMKYKAATEGSLYGALWLATGHPFTIESWRLFALGAVALGIVAFALLARWTLRWWALAIVLALLILDSTVILGTRQNWGPVALGLVERLFLLGVFLRGLGKHPSSPWTAFLLGAIVGVATFDKLSSVALVAPVALWLLLDDGGNRIRRVLAAIGGGIVGGIPLVVINLKWAGSYSMFFSLGEVHGTHEHSTDSYIRVLTGCLKLGSGRGFSDEMVGHGPAPWAEWCEALSMSAVIVAALVLAIGSWRTSRDSRHGGLLALSWIAVVAALYALPELTHHHHWPMSIPFVPVAAALALQGIAGSFAAQRPLARIAGIVLIGAVLLLGAARISSTARIQQDIREGVVTRKWDPGLNALGRFANDRPSSAGFVAAGWGVATQIFCFSQGRGGIVDELYSNYQGAAQLAAQLEARGWNEVYVVALEPPHTLHAEAALQIFADAKTLSGWRVEPVDQELAAIECVRSLKLVRAR